MNVTNLEIPRFCTTEKLAEAFGFSPHWLYKLNNRGKGPPRLKGVRPYRYDTQSREFCHWLAEMGVDVGQDKSLVDIEGRDHV
jgi:hypothetical protein